MTHGQEEVLTAYGDATSSRSSQACRGLSRCRLARGCGSPRSSSHRGAGSDRRTRVGAEARIPSGKRLAAVCERLVELLDPQPGDDRCSSSRPAPVTRASLAAERSGPTGRLLSTDVAPGDGGRGQERRASELGLTNVDFLRRDAQALELPDASVDGVLCRWGYMVDPDPSAAFSETARVLRPARACRVRRLGEADENPWATAVGRVLVALGLIGPPGTRRSWAVPARRPGTSTAPRARTPVSRFSRRRTSS